MHYIPSFLPYLDSVSWSAQKGCLVGKLELNIPLEGPARRKSMNLKESGSEGVDCIHQTQYRIQWWALGMNIRVPWEVGNLLTSWVTISCSRRTLLHGVCLEGGIRGSAWRVPVSSVCSTYILIRADMAECFGDCRGLHSAFDYAHLIDCTCR